MMGKMVNLECSVEKQSVKKIRIRIGIRRRGMNGGRGENRFIEIDISRNKNSVGFQIQDFVPFDTMRVTKENTFSSLRSKFISVVRKSRNKAQASKGSQMNIRRRLVE